MEQVEGGDLIVNKGDESRPKDERASGRDINATEGFEAALKLAQVCACILDGGPPCLILCTQANIDELVKQDNKPAVSEHSSAEVPVTYSHVYIRIQPFTSPITVPPAPAPAGVDTPAPSEPSSQTQLKFLLQLVDPGHHLSHITVTQSVPARWLSIWDKYEWVEDMVVETLRHGVEVIGQEYVVARMRWDEDAAESADVSAPAAA
jgi:hypothetical protein